MFIGNQKIINLLDKSLKKGKIAQAYLFSGPESVGKFLLAGIFAGRLIENRGNWGNWENQGDYKDQKKPVDLVVIEPEREEKKGIVKEKDIKIGQIREAQKFLLTYPVRGKYKVLIINNAQRMTEASQNSLLKILEEPNSTSIIILVTHEPAKILPTLRSRCQKINFSLVIDSEIKKGLQALGIKTSGELADLTMGKPGTAIILSQDGVKFDKWRKSVMDLRKLSGLSVNQRLELAGELSKNIVEAVKKLELWIWTLHFRGVGSASRDDFRRIELIEESILIITQTNANSRLVLENLLINL